jgi:hypothetical protein
MSVHHNIECPTRYRTRYFCNNFITNGDIATQFEADLPHGIRNVMTTNVLLFKIRCNIFIGVRIIKEMPGSVASGAPHIITNYSQQDTIFPEFIYFYRRSTCFRRIPRPSSGAHNCTYSFRYCQPILLLAATVEEMALT